MQARLAKASPLIQTLEIFMTFIRIKDSKAPPNKLIYQGPANIACECVFDEQLIQLWGSDSGFEYGSFEAFLTPEEARKIAKQLLQYAATIESGIQDE